MKIMINYELFHSDTYLGKDYSDGIRHWKYIKREKMPNGSYRYYYDSKNKDELKYRKEKNSYITNTQNAKKAKKLANKNYKHLSELKTTNDKVLKLKKYNKEQRSLNNDEERKKELQKAYKMINKKHRQVIKDQANTASEYIIQKNKQSEYEKKAKKSLKYYNKNKNKIKIRRNISKGMAKTMTALSRLKNKFKK